MENSNELSPARRIDDLTFEGTFMFFDTHAHLDIAEFDDDRDELLGRLEKEGRVTMVVNPGVNIETSRNAVTLANRYPWIYAAVGYHPQETHAMKEEHLAELAELAKDPKVVAIGEIGLDYYHKETPKDVQEHWFREQIRLAIRLGLPFVIHDREAHGDVHRILLEERAFENTRVLMHCYSGSAETAKEYRKLGCYFSIAGPVTYGNNRKAAAVLAEIPFDRMVLETDAPFLTPEPYRGKRKNDPSLVELTARKVAEFKGVSLEDVAEHTMATAKHFFGIE